jgi:hypothetical protein
MPALFLVNREISADAMSLYYSRKRHTIYPPHHRSFQAGYSEPEPWWNDCPCTTSKTELSLYLSAITRGALRRITSLEWIVPYWAATRLSPHKRAYDPYGRLEPKSLTMPYWHDYLDTLHMMEYGLDLQNLTLIFNCDLVWRLHNIFEDEEKLGREHCLNLVYPIRRLASAGLENFCVRSRSPGYQSDFWTALESEMERLVMSAKYDTEPDIDQSLHTISRGVILKTTGKSSVSI